MDQRLFVQHSVTVVDEDPLELLVFNNGRAPDRMFSTVDRVALVGGTFTQATAHGPRVGHAGAFYAHHSSGVRPCRGGGFLVCLGPQGIIFEVDAEGEEVWRYVSPVEHRGEAAPHGVCAQGKQRGAGRYGLFFAQKYDASQVPRLAGLAGAMRLEDT